MIEVPSHIRSFVLRPKRLTAAQDYALKNVWPRFGLQIEDGIINLEKIFNRAAPRVLEIGFGTGQSLLTQASENPDKDFIGIEVYPSGVGSLLHGIEKLQLNNIRIFQEDAVLVLQQCIAPQSFDLIQIFFPDPWPKRRHQKRRLIQAEFVELLATKLKPEGIVHLATDWLDYAEQMLSVLSASSLRNLSAAFLAEKNSRPITKFEARGEQLGHIIRELKFIRE